MTDRAVLESDVASAPPSPDAADPLAAEDPHGALRLALAGGIDPSIPSEDVVLSWLLRLPDGLDPAIAAGRVMAGGGMAAPRNERLFALLAEITCWPAQRLARLSRHAGRAAACPGPR